MNNRSMPEADRLGVPVPYCLFRLDLTPIYFAIYSFLGFLSSPKVVRFARMPSFVKLFSSLCLLNTAWNEK